MSDLQKIQDSPAGPLRAVEGSFSFACHPGVDCFGVCCQKLDLVLTPYDLLRLKGALGLPAKELLETHTVPADPSRSRWPLIRLKMGEDGLCPFLSPEGCRVYPDRPSACRTYPLARAAKKGGDGRVEERFYQVREDHCLGFDQDRVQTVEQWVVDQGLTVYHHYNDLWAAIVTHPQGPGEGPQGRAKAGMFYLASYNLDRFFEFVSSPKFMSLVELDQDRLDKLADNPEELLQLAFDWMRFSFFGEQTLKVKLPSS